MEKILCLTWFVLEHHCSNRFLKFNLNPFYEDDCEYDFEYNVDKCDHEETFYDNPCDKVVNTCRHRDLSSISMVDDLSKYDDISEFRSCCEMEPSTGHGYLFNDDCEVNNINFISKYK